jgi:hypothetical protein
MTPFIPLRTHFMCKTQHEDEIVFSKGVTLALSLLQVGGGVLKSFNLPLFPSRSPSTCTHDMHRTVESKWNLIRVEIV